jgi:hypothetical protein
MPQTTIPDRRWNALLNDVRKKGRQRVQFPPSDFAVSCMPSRLRPGLSPLL